jgi:predicted nucleic acid-binding protein
MRNVTWVDETLHEAGLDILAGAPSGKLSVVDTVGFATMGALKITRAFACDKHFSERGYELV